jgi:IMP cyclohydrolase
MGIYLVRAKEYNCLKCNRLFLVKANTKIESIKKIVDKLNTPFYTKKYKKYKKYCQDYCQDDFTSVRIENIIDEYNDICTLD